MELQSKIAEIKDSNASFIRMIGVIDVVDDGTQREAVEILTVIKKRKDRLEDLRKFFTKPLNDQVKEINNMFKMESVPLAEAERTIKFAVNQYMTKVETDARAKAEKLRIAEEARLKKEAAKAAKTGVKPKAQPAPPPPVEVPEQKIQAEGGKIVRKKVWKFEVEDMPRFKKNNPDLTLPDEKQINKLIQQGVRDIKGLRIYEDAVISTYS